METIKPYGYVIEMTINYHSGRKYTELYWNHKFYRTIEIAEESLNNIMKTPLVASELFKCDYKIVPLYKKEEL